MAPFYRGFDPVFRLDSDDIQVRLKLTRACSDFLFYFSPLRVSKHFTAEERQVVAAVWVHQARQREQQKLRQCCAMTIFSVESQRSMPSLTLAIVPRTLSRATNITSSQRTRLLTVTPKQSPKAGRDFQATSTLLSHTRTEKLTSSRAPSTGGITAANLTETIRRRSTRASLESPTISTLLWCGAETAKFTSTREVNSGASIHSRDRQSSRPTPSPSATGREFPTTSMLPCNTPMATLTSSRVTSTTDSTTEPSRWVEWSFKWKVSEIKRNLQQVDIADPAFPRPTAHWWFGCKNSQVSGNFKESQRQGSSEDVDGDYMAAG